MRSIGTADREAEQQQRREAPHPAGAPGSELVVPTGHTGVLPSETPWSGTAKIGAVAAEPRKPAMLATVPLHREAHPCSLGAGSIHHTDER
jgi:hypothetical protein